jgi:hypothetical protein
MNILRVLKTKTLNFKIARQLLSTLFVREARALLCELRLFLGRVGIYDSEDRRIFLNLGQKLAILEHGFNVKLKK